MVIPSSASTTASSSSSAPPPPPRTAIDPPPSAAAAAGKVVVMVSSDLPEVLGMADRILVMHDGRIIGRIDDASTATQESIMELAVT
jgi:ABC-type cobalamin transport system ATPase subunit